MSIMLNMSYVARKMSWFVGLYPIKQDEKERI
jgi:NhaP-type Na+/H+ and K+/H+ antiporter